MLNEKNFKEKYAFGSAVEYISSVAIASSLMYFPSKIESETGFLTATKNLILKFHNYMMDIEDNKKMEVVNIDDAYCPYTIDSEVFDVILAHEQRCQNSVVAFVEIDVNNLPQDSEGKRFLFRRGLDVFQSSIVQFRSFNGPKVYYNSRMLDLDVIDQAWEIVEI